MPSHGESSVADTTNNMCESGDIKSHVGQDTTLNLSSLTSIQDQAFKNLEHTVKVVLSPLLTSIGACAFMQCVKLRKLDIPDSVEEIQRYAFMNCYALVKVRLPVDLTVISEGLFMSCCGLKEIHLPLKCEVVGAYAMAMCTQLSYINLPPRCHQLGVGAFQYCRHMKIAFIDCRVRVIPPFCFYCCESLQVLVLGRHVTDIADSAFNFCSELSYIIVEGDVDRFNQTLHPDLLSLVCTYVDYCIKALGLSRYRFNEEQARAIFYIKHLPLSEEDVCHAIQDLFGYWRIEDLAKIFQTIGVSRSLLRSLPRMIDQLAIYDVCCERVTPRLDEMVSERIALGQLDFLSPDTYAYDALPRL